MNKAANNIFRIRKIMTNGFLNIPYSIAGVIDNWYIGHFPKSESIMFSGRKMELIE